jgi:heme exporter protein D
VTFGAMILLVVLSFSQHKGLLKSVLKEQQRQVRIKEAREKSHASSAQ